MPSETLKSFFRFLSGSEDDSALSGRLAAMVERAKTNGQWRQQFMTWEEEMKEQAQEAFEEGAAQARATVAVETARRLLDNGKLSEQEISDITGISAERLAQLQLG